MIWPMRDVSTFLEIKLAVGRLGWIREKASVRPTEERIEVSSRQNFSDWRSLTRDSDGQNQEKVDVQELPETESVSAGRQALRISNSPGSRPEN